MRDWKGLLPALALVLTACSAGPAAPPQAAPAQTSAGAPPAAARAEPAAPAQPTAAPAPRAVQMALSSLSAVNAPLWLAADEGIFRRHGLEVELTSMTPAAATQALTAGSVPLTVTGASSVTAWVGGAHDLAFVAGLSNRAVFKIYGRPEIARLEDLRGKAIGSSTPGSGLTLALVVALRRFNLEPDRDVTVTYLREQPGVLAGLLTDVVQAAGFASPFSEEAQAQGMRLLVDMRDLNVELLTNNITTTRTQLARDPDLVRRVLMAYIEGITLARQQPALAAEAIARGSRSDDREAALSGYREYLTVWNPWPSEPAIQILLDNMDQPEARTAKPGEMIDLRPLRELESSGWLAAHYQPD